MRWLLLLLVLQAPALAMPVVPNFRTGTMTSRTESTTQVTETIKSVDYATGYTYSASGSGVQHSGTSILPGAGPGIGLGASSIRLGNAFSDPLVNIGGIIGYDKSISATVGTSTVMDVQYVDCCEE